MRKPGTSKHGGKDWRGGKSKRSRHKSAEKAIKQAHEREAAKPKGVTMDINVSSTMHNDE